MRQVSLQDVLDAKERRASVQAELRNKHAAALASITVNCPGRMKYTPDTVELLYQALDVFRRAVAARGLNILEERIFHPPTGPEAVLAVAGDHEALKTAGLELEEQLPYGRLLDIDVFSADGRLITRQDRAAAPRTCFICEQPAAACVRAQAHPVPELAAAFQARLDQFWAERTSTWSESVRLIGTLALEAALMEAACTPAPGLVDRLNAGAHQDMDYFTFLKSSSALSTTFFRCAQAGWLHDGEPALLLPCLRQVGREGERDMLAATDGVNTQKGLVFILGLLAATAAYACRQGLQPAEQNIRMLTGQMCAGLVQTELASLKEGPAVTMTAGERLYLAHGVTGIRGEMAGGMPSVAQQGLPRLQEALAAGASLNDALVHSLIGLMTVVEDTTVVNRHSLAVLYELQAAAAAAMAAGGMLTEAGRLKMFELDEYCIRKNISPGGSADLLAATYFLHFCETRLSAASGYNDLT